ncbi:MAG: B12-binding domain-containing protein [Propionibacteriaceae bacterium]
MTRGSDGSGGDDAGPDAAGLDRPGLEGAGLDGSDDDFGGDDGLDEETVLTIQQVSRLLMVPAPTIRSWERRYDIGTADRSVGGHRRYSSDTVRSIRQMRDDIAQGHRPVEAAARIKVAQTVTADPLVDRFLEAVRRLDPTAIEAVLEDSQRVLGLDRSIDEILLPSLRELGRWWEAGTCDIAHEHLASEVTRAWLARVPQHLASRGQDRPIVLSCGPRDFHTIGLEAIGALFRQRGWECLLLGARTPAAALCMAVTESNAAALVMVSHLATARRSTIEALREVAQLPVKVFYAGNAFPTRQARQGVPGSYLGTNLSQAAEFVTTAIARDYKD